MEPNRKSAIFCTRSVEIGFPPCAQESLRFSLRRFVSISNVLWPMRKTPRRGCSGSASRTYMAHSALFGTKPRLMCKYLLSIKVRSLFHSSNRRERDSVFTSALDGVKIARVRYLQADHEREDAYPTSRLAIRSLPLRDARHGGRVPLCRLNRCDGGRERGDDENYLTIASDM